jgi:hypothetical protein
MLFEPVILKPMFLSDFHFHDIYLLSYIGSHVDILGGQFLYETIIHIGELLCLYFPSAFPLVNTTRDQSL